MGPAVIQVRATMAVGALLLMGAAADQQLPEAARLLEAGEPAAAEQLYRQTLERHPYRADVHQGLARALAAQGRAAEGVEALLAGAERLLSVTRYGQAAELAAAAAERSPASPRAHQLLGRALVMQRAYARAEPALRRAVELGQADPATRLFLASTLWENGRLVEAEELLRRLVEDGSEPAVALLGRLLLWQGRYAEAVPWLERAVARRPRTAGILFALARAQEGSGDAAGALWSYRRAVELEPRFAPAHYGLARLLARAGEGQAAERRLADYRRLYEDEIRATREAGLVQARIDGALDLTRQGRFGPALAALGELPESGEVLAARGRVQAAAGDHAAAVHALERALLALPDRRDLQALLAEARLALEEPR